MSIDLLLYEGYEALGHLEVATMLLHWWAICSLEPLAVGHRVVVVEVRLHFVLHVVLLKLLRRDGDSIDVPGFLEFFLNYSGKFVRLLVCCLFRYCAVNNGAWVFL